VVLSAMQHSLRGMPLIVVNFFQEWELRVPRDGRIVLLSYLSKYLLPHLDDRYLM
jgi:hypothetical protein